MALTRYDHLTVDDLPERVSAHEPAASATPDDDVAGIVPLAEMERRYVKRVLGLVGGNKSRAARLLGLDRSTLARMFDREAHAEHHDSTPPDGRAQPPPSMPPARP